MISVQGELQHRMIKCRFPRTNKRRYTSQLAAAEVRERCMRRIAQHLTYHAKLSQIRERRTRRRKQLQAESNEGALDSSDPNRRYDIANTTKEKLNILEWVDANRTDAATKVGFAKYRHTY